MRRAAGLLALMTLIALCHGCDRGDDDDDSADCSEIPDPAEAWSAWQAGDVETAFELAEMGDTCAPSDEFKHLRVLTHHVSGRYEAAISASDAMGSYDRDDDLHTAVVQSMSHLGRFDDVLDYAQAHGLDETYVEPASMRLDTPLSVVLTSVAEIPFDMTAEWADWIPAFDAQINGQQSAIKSDTQSLLEWGLLDGPDDTSAFVELDGPVCLGGLCQDGHIATHDTTEHGNWVLGGIPTAGMVGHGFVVDTAWTINFDEMSYGFAH